MAYDADVLVIGAGPAGRPDMIRLTLQIMLINLLYVLSIYYMLSWIPQMVAELASLRRKPRGFRWRPISAAFSAARPWDERPIGWA